MPTGYSKAKTAKIPASHSKKHTPKHLKEMKLQMKRGASLSAAHQKAMKKVGK